MSNTLPVNPEVATKAIKDCITVGLVPMLAGSPGVGKSSIMRQVAEELNLEYIDIRLAQSDPLDLVGLPVLLQARRWSSYLQHISQSRE